MRRLAPRGKPTAQADVTCRPIGPAPDRLWAQGRGCGAGGSGREPRALRHDPNSPTAATVGNQVTGALPPALHQQHFAQRLRTPCGLVQHAAWSDNLISGASVANATPPFPTPIANCHLPQ